MILSHFVEKLKIGKKYVLLNLVVHPDCQRPWESAGPENKFISAEGWKVIYKKLEGICRKQFPDRSKSEDTGCDVDKEYECRLEGGRQNFLLKYEFKDQGAQTILNMLFNDEGHRLHGLCLEVQIWERTKDLVRELRDKDKIIERLQKENEKLRELPAPSQEYTPAPVVKKSSSSSAASNVSSLEYIPTAINGASPVVHSSSYKARKIEDTVKLELEPYTPISSQETASPEKPAYVPRSLRTPSKSDPDVKAVSQSSSQEISVNRGKRRRREKDIFGSEDEEDNGKSSMTPGKVKAEVVHNRSDEDLFGPELSPTKPYDNIVGSSSTVGDEPEGELFKDIKRMHLPRKTKAGVSYGGLMMSPDEKPPSTSTTTTTPATVTKRRRKDEESSGVSKSRSGGSSSNKSNLDGWLEKSSRKKEESSHHKSKDKENDKGRKSKKDKDDTVAAPAPMKVDHDKLKEEAEQMRKTIAGCDQLDKMLPEDKTLLDIPILNCYDMPISEIQKTFDLYRDDLKFIYDQHKDKTRRGLLESNLVDFTEVTGVLTDEQTYAMMQRLEEEFNPEDLRGMYTEFFASTLIMEWGLRIWMDRHGYSDRKEALERIKLQEEANPMDLTPTTLNSLMGSRSHRKR